MPSTPFYGWPYPSPGDSGDVPYWLQRGLEAAEATVKAARPISFAGSANVPSMAAGANTGVGVVTVSEGGSAITGGQDLIQFATAGLVTLTALFYMVDSTRAKRALLSRGATYTNVVAQASWAAIDDRVSFTYTTRVTAGEQFRFMMWINGGAAVATTFGLGGIFFPSYA